QLRDARSPVPPSSLQELSLWLIQYGDIAVAHDVLEQAVRTDEASTTPVTPGKGRRLVLFGRVLLERGDFRAAIERLMQGLLVPHQTLQQAAQKPPQVLSSWADPTSPLFSWPSANAALTVTHPEVIEASLYLGKAFLLIGDSQTAKTVLYHAFRG